MRIEILLVKVYFVCAQAKNSRAQNFIAKDQQTVLAMKTIQEVEALFHSPEQDAATLSVVPNEGMLFGLCGCCHFPCLFVTTVCFPGCSAGAQCSALDHHPGTDSVFYCLVTNFTSCLAAPIIRLGIADRYGTNEWCLSSVIKGFFFPCCSLQQTFLELHIRQEGIGTSAMCLTPTISEAGAVALFGKKMV